jgi:hypothetical protein
MSVSWFAKMTVESLRAPIETKIYLWNIVSTIKQILSGILERTNQWLKTRETQSKRDKTSEIATKKFEMDKISCIGNFIKPRPFLNFIGTKYEAATPKKPEEGRRGGNYRKWHRRSLARFISRCPVCIICWTMYRWTWSGIHILEITIGHHGHIKYRSTIAVQYT